MQSLWPLRNMHPYATANCEKGAALVTETKWVDGDNRVLSLTDRPAGAAKRLGIQ